MLKMVWVNKRKSQKLLVHRRSQDCDIYHITGRAFVPAPEVDVGVVHIVPRVQPLINLPFSLVEKVVRHIYHFRQKYIRRGIEYVFIYCT